MYKRQQLASEIVGFFIYLNTISPKLALFTSKEETQVKIETISKEEPTLQEKSLHETEIVIKKEPNESENEENNPQNTQKQSDNQQIAVVETKEAEETEVAQTEETEIVQTDESEVVQTNDDALELAIKEFTEKVSDLSSASLKAAPVSYTHLTLPTKRIV